MLKKIPNGWIQILSGIEEEEVEIAVRDLPEDKAPGPDLISNEIYQNCPAAHAPLAKFFNNVMRRVYVPKEVRLFYVIPLDKPGQVPRSAPIDSQLRS